MSDKYLRVSDLKIRLWQIDLLTVITKALDNLTELTLSQAMNSMQALNSLVQLTPFRVLIYLNLSQAMDSLQALNSLV